MLYLHLEIDPKSKQRPRFRRVGGKVCTYTPPQTKEYENMIKLLARPQVDKPLLGPLRCEICFFIKPPKMIKSKYPISKRSGDVDNLAKAVLDALNGVCYEDDSQIISLTCSKYYREVSGIELRLYSLN